MSLMLEEIFDQPPALRRTFRAERAHAEAVKRYARKKGIRLIVLVARGTSDNAALFGRYLLELTTGIPVSLAASSIHTLYHTRLYLRDAVVVGVSQSGEGTDINMVLESAKRRGAFTIGITNEPRSTMAGIADEVFLVRAGRQRSVAATKTYTGQLLMFYLLAGGLGPQVSLESVSEIPDRVEEALKLEPEIRSLVERYRYMRHCVVVARGLNLANAYEMALKLMETCYVVAERFSSADFAHGPVALVERDFPVILFMPPGKVFADLKKLAVRLRKLHAETLLISSAGAKLPPSTRTIRVPGEIPEIYTPIPYIVPGQLFAASLAEVKGIDPDKPRSLQIVTRTV
jgi:glucosamine--fructose-6-phosphate aminotransferase (isomerizing)